MERLANRETEVKRKPLKFGNAENAKVLRHYVKTSEQRHARLNSVNDRRGLVAKNTDNVSVPVSGNKAFTLGTKPQVLGTNTTLMNAQAVTKPRTKEELLAKLKVYKEQKRVVEAQRRAEKKPAFVVPAHIIAKIPAEEEARPALTRSAATKQVLDNKRVTRSQAQKLKAPVAASAKVSHELPSRAKNQATQKNPPKKDAKLKKNPVASKPEPRKSFAPVDFQFKAPLAVQNYSHLFNPVNEAKLSTAIEGLSFASPKPAPPQELPRISPQIFDHPNVTRTRGSSSKRKQARDAAERLLEAEKSQLSSPNVKPADSPTTAQRTERSRSPLRKLVYSPVPETNGPVSNQQVVTSEADEITDTCGTGSQTSESVFKNVKFFRELLQSEGARLTQCCAQWTEILNTADPQPSENVCDAIRCVVGQAYLLQKERFAQFSGLVDNCEFGTGDMPVHASDLEGFWDMVNFQVIDVDKKFADLTKLKANNWQEEEVVVVKRKAAKKPVKKPTLVVRPTLGKSSLRDIMNAKRRELAGSKSPKGSLSSVTPSRSSVRRSALLNSAKKAEQAMTEGGQLGQTPRGNRRRSSHKISLTPKTNEPMEAVDSVGTPSPRKVRKTPRKSVAKALENELPAAANDVIFSTGAKSDQVEDSEDKDESSENGSISGQFSCVPTIHIDAPSAVPMAEIPMPEVHHTYSRKQPDVDAFSPEKTRNAIFDSLLEPSQPAAALSPRYFEPDSETSFLLDDSDLAEMEVDAEDASDANLGITGDEVTSSTSEDIGQPRRSKRFSAARQYNSNLTSIPELKERVSVSSPDQQCSPSGRSQRRRTQRRPSLLCSPESPMCSKILSPDQDLMKFS